MLSFFGIVPHGHMLDLPNGYLGMLFYTFILLRYNTVGAKNNGPLLFQPIVNLMLSFLSFASSIFLARKLYIIREICVLCLSTHIINTTIFYRSIKEAFGNTASGGKVKEQ